MKVFILYNTIKGPYGGANQFISNLKKEFREREILAKTPDEADAVLFNSHSMGGRKGNAPALAVDLKYKFPNAVFVHRVDGPIMQYRGAEYSYVDRKIYMLNELVADITVFQSEWSREENYRLGYKQNSFETTILNSSDPDIFYPKKDSDADTIKGKKVKVIASSFSSHPNKGHRVYEWLDKNLDFSKFEMTFVGNTPVTFQSIKHIPEVDPETLADLLREHDIYLTASKKDPCSNALIEALHCGLPAVAYNDGGHPEIVGKGGELFTEKEEIPHLLEKVADSYEFYRRQISVSDMSAVADSYQRVMEGVVNQVASGEYVPHALSWWSMIRAVVYYRVSKWFGAVKKKLTIRRYE